MKNTSEQEDSQDQEEEEEEEQQQKEEQSHENSTLRSLLKSISLGTDLTKSSLPISIFYPKSFLEVYTEQSCKLLMLLDKASKEKEPLQKFISVIWYVLSSFGDYPNAKKPFNPILGEIFQGEVVDSSSSSSTAYANFVAEQVEHHPPTSTLSILSDTFQLCINLTQEASFWGKHLKVKNSGKGVITLKHGNLQVYEIVKFPNLFFRFLSWRSEWSGELKLNCLSTGYSCTIQFKDKKLFGERDRVEGEIISNESKNPICKISGVWSKSVSIVDTNSNEEVSSYQFSTFTPFNIQEANPNEERSSSKVWGKVTKALQSDDLDTASEEKKKIENEQRERNNQGTSFEPKYFYFDSKSHLWQLKSSANPT